MATPQDFIQTQKLELHYMFSIIDAERERVENTGVGTVV